MGKDRQQESEDRGQRPEVRKQRPEKPGHRSPFCGLCMPTRGRGWASAASAISSADTETPPWDSVNFPPSPLLYRLTPARSAHISPVSLPPQFFPNSPAHSAHIPPPSPCFPACSAHFSPAFPCYPAHSRTFPLFPPSPRFLAFPPARSAHFPPFSRSPISPNFPRASRARFPIRHDPASRQWQ